MHNYIEPSFRKRLRGVGDGSADVTISDRSPSPDVMNVYTSVVIENETSNGTVATIQVRNVSRIHKREYFAAFNSSIPQRYDNSVIVVGDDENLEVVLASTTNSDVLSVYLEGYTVKLRKE